jgi:anti-sigma factor RsiW
VRSAQESHVEDRILAYLAGELTESEAGRVREHLRTCDSCQRVSRELMALERVLDSDVIPELSGPVWSEVQARLRPATRRPVQLRWGMGAVSAAAVGVLIGLSAGTKAPPAQDDSAYPLWSAVGSSLSADRSIASDVYGESAFEGVQN